VDRAEALSLLRRELASYAARPHAELATLAGGTDVVVRQGASGTEYQLEVETRWDDHVGGALRISGAIDDGTLRASLRPLAEDVLVDAPADR
jgi:hypothetical protein